MRSSDIILGIAYDVPAFTTMQEILANELGVDLGEYVHTSNSLHCYERDFEMLGAIANSSDNLGRPMPEYPGVFPINDLMRIEAQVHEMTDGEFMDGMMLLSPKLSDLMNDPVTNHLVNDWMNILCSFRARKMKDTQLAQRYLFSTKHKGYHFFKR
jgi:hypothetical protein